MSDQASAHHAPPPPPPPPQVPSSASALSSPTYNNPSSGATSPSSPSAISPSDSSNVSATSPSSESNDISSSHIRPQKQHQPRPLTLVTPASPQSSHGSLGASQAVSASMGSLSGPMDSEAMLKRGAAGKAGRKRRPDSVVTPSHAPNVTDQAWASPAAVAAVSMSRIKGNVGDVGEREVSGAARKPKQHRGSYMGSGDELDEIGSGADSDASGGGGVAGATRVVNRSAAAGVANRKRISMVNEEDPMSMGPPPPGVTSNVGIGQPLGQRHHESMEHLAAQSAVTKNRSKFESSWSGSSLALNSTSANNLSKRDHEGDAFQDHDSNPTSPLGRSLFSLNTSAASPLTPSSVPQNTVAAGSPLSASKTMPNASMSSIATTATTATRAGKGGDFFGFSTSKRKASAAPSVNNLSGDAAAEPGVVSSPSKNAGTPTIGTPTLTSSVAASPASGYGYDAERSGAGGLATSGGSGGSPTAGLPTAAHPALNISGGVGARKNRKASTLSLAAAAAASSPNDEKGAISPKKGLKAMASSDAMRPTENLLDTNFPSTIDLGSLFGTKNTPQMAFERMMWAARCYEVAKPIWAKQQSTAEQSPTRSNPSEEIKYRILENFKDGKLETLTYERKNNATEFIALGPPEALIDALIFPLNQDNSYAEVFMATYRFFLPPMDVLTSLIEWYNVEVDEQATPQQEAYLKRNRKYFRARSIRSLLIWIKNHWHDFHCDRMLLDELMAFVAEVSEVSFGDSQKMTQAIREQRLAWYMTQYIPLFSNKRAASTESSKPWGLLWEAEAFAEQLTLIDFDLFRQIRPDAFLHLMHKPAGREVGGNVALKVLLEYCGWFRLLSNYVATLVMREDGSKKRAKALKKLIKVARACKDLNNFNSTFAVIHGLKRPAVFRQTSAWEQVPAKYLDIFREMEHLMDSTDGYSNFWTELKSTHPPAIPFFAAYIHDLLEIHHDIPVYLAPPTSTADAHDSNSRIVSINDDDANNSNSSFTPRVVHFAKFYDLYAVVAELEVWRTSSYSTVMQIPERETTAIVLNHIADYPLLDDRALNSDGSPAGLAAAALAAPSPVGASLGVNGGNAGSGGSGLAGKPTLKKAGSFMA
ncbi:hypothetical protein HDU97_006161 [Phlyctochytrium planicorne]|nr:hypothetical protein HDU97_006161 [Phlyctochytrium planicorne]